jgi:thiamine-phosphate pyrophosphorylase
VRDLRLRGLYVIADTGVTAPELLHEALSAALRGGARAVQFRDKGMRLRHAARKSLRALCAEHGALFIINDDPALAAELHADGVHLGRDDGGIARAREFLGKHALVGVSCYNDLERAIEMEARGADYVAFGSFYQSLVKADAVRAPISLLQRAHARLRIPIVAIGGITPANAVPLIEAGATAVAVISAVFARPDIEAAARRFTELFSQPSQDAP